MPKRKAKTKNQVSYWHKKLLGSGGVFSRYVRLRDSAAYLNKHPEINEIGSACISCNVFYPIKSLQAGHFITTQKTFIKYHEQNVHAQCYNCNINLKGNWTGYLEAMVARYGQLAVDNLMSIRNNPKKFNVIELEELYDRCVESIAELEKQTGKVW